MSREVALPVGDPVSGNGVGGEASADALTGSSAFNGGKGSFKSSTSSGDYALEDFWTKNCPQLEYRNVDGEAELSRPDLQRHDRGRYHWLRTVVRGRSFALIPVLLSVSWAALAVYISYVVKHAVNYTRDGCVWFCTPLALDATTHSYVGFALFLLLGFRVNESYSRYMEGMRIWTSIAGTCTSTAKYFLQAFPPGMFHAGDRERMLGWLVAYPVALKRELRDERDLRELRNVLATEDLAELQNAPNMASHTLFVLSAYILRARTGERRFPQTFLVHLIRWIADLASAADMCIQIKRMPCAFSYVAHLRTFLALWLFFLPFTLVESTGWGTPLIVAFITYGIVGIELNAAELENPFGVDYNDLPLGRIVEEIQQGVKATYKASKVPSRRYVHGVEPVVPPEGTRFWLDDNEVE